VKYNNSILITFFVLVLVVFSCESGKKKETFRKSPNGYWFRLLSFDEIDSAHYEPDGIAWVNAVFKTQNDSVFYDTRNDLKDRFFVRTDTAHQTSVFKYAIACSGEGDSLCILIKTAVFFKEQFNSKVPEFCQKDSVVKIYYKVKNMLTKDEFAAIVRKNTNNELQEIENFFGSPENFEKARDPLGFYWVEKPGDTTSAPVEAGNTISVSYSGGFLNGRIIDVSPGNFQVVYGTPDQLLKGLNYVISRLKVGQTSKIILPSHLAFGESGSSNGSVPPFTPMLYKISINN
jgi:FKBP-type peptidyl-prolyl cis-trans isomerase